MKFLSTHFDDYIQNYNKCPLHSSLKKIYASYPNDLNDLKNIIFYGPAGVGKYTQMLACIKKYSPSELKYEKRLTCVYNKTNYFFKISDVHFEIDMALLGCNAKLLWNEIYINIIDVLSSRTNKAGIVVCKNFHKIHSELLDCFYSYMQNNNMATNITYIFLTENISFIPDNILNTFNIVSIPRPTKTLYNKITGNTNTNMHVEQIYNIKNLTTNTNPMQHNMKIYTEKIYSILINPATIKFTGFRDIIYDIFIYDIDISYIIWELLKKMMNDKKLSTTMVSDIFIEMFTFLQYYNNNYRPIYHIEKFLYSIINKIHGFQ